MTLIPSFPPLAKDTGEIVCSVVSNLQTNYNNNKIAHEISKKHVVERLNKQYCLLTVEMSIPQALSMNEPPWSSIRLTPALQTTQRLDVCVISVPRSSPSVQLSWAQAIHASRLSPSSPHNPWLMWSVRELSEMAERIMGFLLQSTNDTQQLQE